MDIIASVSRVEKVDSEEDDKDFRICLFTRFSIEQLAEPNLQVMVQRS